MNLLTQKQVKWLFEREIKVGNLYPLPSFGFYIYFQPDFEEYSYIDNNSFTKSLDKELFEVKEKLNGFCKGNFHKSAKTKDFWIREEKLAERGIIEVILLFIIAFIPMIIYNLFNKIK